MADKLITVAEAQAMAGGRIQPARRGVGAMVACEDHAFQRLVKVEIHLELEVPRMVSPVVDIDVEGLKRLVRGCVRVLFACKVSPDDKAVAR